MQKKISWLKFFLPIAGVVFVLFWILMFYGMNWHFFDINTNNVPKFIQADFIDLSKVRQVSKYRSGVGHDASFDGEDCRSMRHYFGYFDPEVTDAKDKAQFRHDTFAPVDGRIMSISGGKSDNGSGQINIRPENPTVRGFEVRIDNVVPEPGLRSFSRVKAGQKIGESLGMSEITIAYHYLFGDHGFSYIQLLPDSIFSKYQEAVGYPISREEFIITKEYRDNNPLTCDNTDGRFFVPSAETESDYNHIFLNGYKPQEKGNKKEEANKKNKGGIDE